MKKMKPKFGPDGYEDDDPSDPDFPFGKLTEVHDFLPPPHELAKARTVVKVTIALDQSSIEFFKKVAKKNNTKYQRMIREVLDQYAARYQEA